MNNETEQLILNAGFKKIHVQSFESENFNIHCTHRNMPSQASTVPDKEISESRRKNFKIIIPQKETVRFIKPDEIKQIYSCSLLVMDPGKFKEQYNEFQNIKSIKTDLPISYFSTDEKLTEILIKDDFFYFENFIVIVMSKSNIGENEFIIKEDDLKSILNENKII